MHTLTGIVSRFKDQLALNILRRATERSHHRGLPGQESQTSKALEGLCSMVGPLDDHELDAQVAKRINQAAALEACNVPADAIDVLCHASMRGALGRQDIEQLREGLATLAADGHEPQKCLGCSQPLKDCCLTSKEREARRVEFASEDSAAVPDAATEGRLTQAELEDIAETHAFCEDRLFIETELVDEIRAERDAATAAIERVAKIHGPSDEFPAGCDYCERLTPCSTRAALDGAPEPEVIPVEGESK